MAKPAVSQKPQSTARPGPRRIQASPVVYRFRLFVAGDAPNSVRAVANLDAICRAHLVDCHEVETVDVLRQPERALENNVLMTPTLDMLTPGPVRRIVGTLNNTQPVLACLGLHDCAA